MQFRKKAINSSTDLAIDSKIKIEAISFAGAGGNREFKLAAIQRKLLEFSPKNKPDRSPISL